MTPFPRIQARCRERPSFAPFGPPQAVTGDVKRHEWRAKTMILRLHSAPVLRLGPRRRLDFGNRRFAPIGQLSPVVIFVRIHSRTQLPVCELRLRVCDTLRDSACWITQKTSGKFHNKSALKLGDGAILKRAALETPSGSGVRQDNSVFDGHARSWSQARPACRQESRIARSPMARGP